MGVAREEDYVVYSFGGEGCGDVLGGWVSWGDVGRWEGGCTLPMPGPAPKTMRVRVVVMMKDYVKGRIDGLEMKCSGLSSC